MATNPLGWILLAVEGVTLLGAEIYKLVKSLWEVPSAAERAAESMEKLNKASAASYEANQRRLERLVQLNDQGGAKTDAQKQEAREIIQTLNAYHDLGLKLDENTGKINVNAAALEKHQEKMRRHRREVLAGTIKANEELLDQRYKELSKKLAGSYSTYDQAKGEAKIRIQIELDKEGDAQIAELKENLEKLREERQKLLNDSDKARREAQERLKQRRQEESKKHEDAFSFMGREWVTMQRAGMSEEEQEIARVKGAYNEQRKEIEKIVKEKKKRLESTAHELATLAALNRSEQQRIEFIRQQYAAKRAEEARKENEKDRQLVEKLTEDRNSKNRTELENEVHQLQKSIAERKERLQKLVDEGKATEEQKQTLQELIELERQRTEQIKQQHAERLKAQIQQFDGNQLNRTRRQQEAAEDRKTRKDIERNPFKAGLNLKAQREEIEAKIEEAKRKVEQAHAFALKQGDLTDKQKAIVEQREKNLLDLQQQQDRLQGLMGEAENEARNRVASLLQQYASEKTPSVLDTKFKGTVEAYKAEIENQQRGQMDGKDVKLENIKTILERDEQRKQQNEQKIIEIGRQIVANLQGV